MTGLIGNDLTNSSTNNERIYSSTQQYNKELSIETLPTEIFGELLSYLEVKDLYSVNQVSKPWNEILIKIKKQEAFSPVLRFTRFLSEKLDKRSYENQMQAISFIEKNTEALSYLSLGRMKRSLNDLEEEVLNVLKEIKEEDLKKVEKECIDIRIRNYFLSVVFELARVYKRIDEVDTMSHQNEKDLFCSEISLDLAQMHRMNKAIDVADKIIEGVIRSEPLKAICIALIKMKKIDKMIEVCNKITNDFIRYLTIRDASTILMQDIQIEGFIKLFKGVVEDRIKYVAFADALGILMSDEDIREVMEDDIFYCLEALQHEAMISAKMVLLESKHEYKRFSKSSSCEIL